MGPLRARRRPQAAGRRWQAGDVFWLLLPVLSVLGVVGYFTASVMLETTPPFSVVSGQSMRPLLAPGDLVVIEGVAAHDVKVGDVISISTPEDEQEEKGLPAEIVHRVVEKQGQGSDISFVTKGDNNPGEDAFFTRPTDIRGEVIHVVPALGYPVLFFRAEQGRIFLGALGLAIVGYFVLAAIERRQEAAELESPRQALEELASEQREDRETLRLLVDAVHEYGVHLKSHTAAVASMALAAQELAESAHEIRSSLADLRSQQPLTPPDDSAT